MRVLILIATMLLAACSPAAWNEKLSTPQERGEAARVIALVRARDVAQLRAVARPDLSGQLTPEAVEKIAALVPNHGDAALVTVSVNSMTIAGKQSTQKAFNYDVGAGKRWALVQIVIDTSTAANKVAGIQVFPSAQRASTVNDFSWAGKSPLHYGWIVMMAAAVVVSVAGVIVAIRSSLFRRRRWLWIAGCALSFVTFSLNWSTGEWTVLPVSFLLLGASAAQAGPFNPWVLSFAIPIVAIVVLFRAWRAQRAVTGTP